MVIQLENNNRAISLKNGGVNFIYCNTMKIYPTHCVLIYYCLIL